MWRTLSAASFVGLVFCAAAAEAQQANAKPAATVTLTQVRAREYDVTELEGPDANRQVLYVSLDCSVVVDNQTGADLTVFSNFHSAFDGLEVVLLKDGKEVRRQPYLYHQSPFSIENRPFVLKPGKAEKQMTFPLRKPPADWAKLQVKITGKLPFSALKETLTSNAKPIEAVKESGR